MTVKGMKRIFLTKLTDVSSSDKEGVGTVRREGNCEYLYCKGVASTITGSVVRVSNDGNYTTALLTTTLGQYPCKLAVAMAAIIADKYGWYQVKGYCAAIYAAASCAKERQIYTDTGTTGGVDDTSTSEHAIHGMLLNTAVGAGGAATTDGYLDYPWTAPTFD